MRSAYLRRRKAQRNRAKASFSKHGGSYKTGRGAVFGQGLRTSWASRKSRLARKAELRKIGRKAFKSKYRHQYRKAF